MTSADKSKIIINDKTMLSTPEDLEYNFQYSDPEEPLTSLQDFATEDSPQHNIFVWAKVLKIKAPKIVTVTHQARTNKVAVLIIVDETASIQLDLWNEQIDQVKENCIYRFTNLSTNYWNNVKKLSATIYTVIKQTENAMLSELQFDEEDFSTPDDVLIVAPRFQSVESVQRFRACCNCNKRIVQLQQDVVTCDHCQHMVLLSHCPLRLCATVVILVDDQKKSLTMFEDSLKELLGEFDASDINTTEVAKNLLLLEDIEIMYNNRNVITKFKVL